MKHQIIIVCLSFGCHWGNAQAWSNRYSDEQENTAIDCYNIEKTTTGYGVFLREQSMYLDGQNESYFWNLGYYKLNEDGSLDFRKYFNDSAHVTQFSWADVTYTDQDGSIILAGYYFNPYSTEPSLGRIMKMTSSGDTIWTKYYGDYVHDHGLYNIRPVSDGGMIAIGTAEFQEGFPKNWALKLDADGIVEWSVYFGAGDHFRSCDRVVESEDHQYFLFGGYEDIENAEPAPRIWIVDAEGNPGVSQNYILGNYNNGSAEGLISSGDGNYLWCGHVIYEHNGTDELGRHVVVKINPQLNIIWTMEFGPDYLMNGCATNTIILTSDGNFICAGTTNRNEEFESFSQGHLTKFSTDGVVIWHRYYEYIGNGYNQLYDVVEAEDGGFVAAGWTMSLDPDDERFSERDCWVLQADSDGCLIPGCVEATSEISDGSLVSIYPNPANSSLCIASTSGESTRNYSMYDATGKLCQAFSLNARSTYILDISQFSSGVYTLIGLFDQLVYRRNFIIQH